MHIIHVPYYTKYFPQQMNTPHPSHEREPMIQSVYIWTQHTYSAFFDSKDIHAFGNGVKEHQINVLLILFPYR